jgi:hypothetical protein
VPQGHQPHPKPEASRLVHVRRKPDPRRVFAVQSNLRSSTPSTTQERHRTPPPRPSEQPRKNAKPRQPSALEIASQGMATRITPPGPSPRQPPLAAASPSVQHGTPLGGREHSFAESASASRQSQTWATTHPPVPTGMGWAAAGSRWGGSSDPVAAGMGWIGTGEGPGCSPTDDRAKQVQSILKRVLMAAMPYLGPNNLNSARFVLLTPATGGFTKPEPY